MATTTNFKQQCPSCEAMVPVRDPKLIGKKIDCPKCKYRFVVEDPMDGDDEDMEESSSKQGGSGKRPVNGKGGALRRDADDDRPAKKKKEGSSTTLILGIGLGAVALILLGVGGYFLFSGGSETKTATKSGGGGSTTPSTDNTEKDAAPEKAFTDPKNLLPNEVDAVRAIAMDQFVQSGAGQATFGTPGAFSSEKFKQKFGLPPEEITNLVTGYNHVQNWVFNIIRTSKPVKRETFANLVLKPATPIEGFNYDIVNADLDSFGFAFLSGGKTRQLALYIMPDEHTFVLADLPPMESFLKAKGQPAYQSQAPAAGAETEEKPANPEPQGKVPPVPGFGNQGGGPPGGAFGGGPPGPIKPQVGGAAGGPSPGGPGFPGGPGQPAAPPQPAPGSGSYLTIRKDLKSMLDKLEDPKQPPLVSMAVDMQIAPNFISKNANQIPLLRVFKTLEEKWKEASIAGAALGSLRTDKIDFTIGIDCKTDQQARELEKEGREALAKKLEAQFKDSFDMEVSLPGQTNQAQPGRGGFPFPGGGPPGFPGGKMPPGMVGPPQGAYGGASPSPGGGFSGGGPGPGAPQGAYGGASPSPGGGFSGGGPGAGAQGLYGGGYPGVGMRPGFGGGPGQTTQQKTDPDASTINIDLKEKTVVFNVDLVFKKGREKSFELLFLEAQGDLVELKGKTDMIDGRTRIHELARAIRSYTDKNKAFPRGTVDRRPGASRGDIPYPPSERVSWMGELLPYINQGEYAGLLDQINIQESWNKVGGEDGAKNLLAAKTLIPCFLAPNTPEETWWVKYPELPQSVASTHYIGIAGLGLDAADYSAKDPSLRKKLGVFGYDRATALEEITDGQEQTIAILQVPPHYKTPWLAGGGSTVRGISETAGIAPFVCTEYKGRSGTFAIMADGAIRFLPKDLPTEKFNALITIAGDDKIDKAELDALCPLVPGEDTSLKAVTPVDTKPVEPIPEKKSEDKKAEDKKPEEKKTEGNKPEEKKPEEKKPEEKKP
jgi:hypothetical protein